MGYSGSFPVSKLTVRDEQFGDVGLDLFAYSALKPRDSKTSATPAVAFTFRINNPTEKTVSVSLMFNLPLGIQTDTARQGESYKCIQMSTVNSTICSKACASDPKCFSWQTETKNKTCLLFNKTFPHYWKPGCTSGQKNTWKAHDSMLTLNRPGNYPQSGNTTIVTEKSHSPSFMVSDSFGRIWKQFSTHGYLQSTAKSFGGGFHGATAINVTVGPGDEETLTMVLGWYYPNRDFTGVQ